MPNSHPSIQIIQDEHSSLAAMLRSLGMMVDRGPGSKPEVYFEAVSYTHLTLPTTSRV